MSATGALILGLTAVFVLGAFAAWLLNVPVWVIAVLLAVGAIGTRWFVKRISRGRARQETEGHR